MRIAIIIAEMDSTNLSKDIKFVCGLTWQMFHDTFIMFKTFDVNYTVFIRVFKLYSFYVNPCCIHCNKCIKRKRKRKEEEKARELPN